MAIMQFVLLHWTKGGPVEEGLAKISTVYVSKMWFVYPFA
jgi:hypothetical protein